MPRSITIALDIMSGDNGPQTALSGAFKSLQSISDLNIILVGDQDIISDAINDLDNSIKGRIDILHTHEFIRMDEDIIHAVRSKKVIDEISN